LDEGRGFVRLNFSILWVYGAHSAIESARFVDYKIPHMSQNQLQQEIYLKMTPAQKWQQVFKLRETAWLLKRAGIKAQHPDWSLEKIEAEVKKIFLYAVT